MSPAPEHDQTRSSATIPAERCLWAILPASALGGASRAHLQKIIRTDANELRDALDRWLPLPQSELHAAFAVTQPPSGEPVVVACAVAHPVLQQALEAGSLAATPAEVHKSILARLAPGALAPADLNLLSGPFEPPAIRSARRSTAWILAIGIAVITAILYFGLNRLTQHHHAQIAALESSTKAVLKRLIPDGDERTIATRATAEARRLKAATAQSGAKQPGSDAAELLAQVLAHWPKNAGAAGLYLTTQSVQIGRTAITFTMTIPASADAEPLIEALGSVPGWTLQQSQRTAATGPSTDHTARLVLRLVPTRAVPKAATPAATELSGGAP